MTFGVAAYAIVRDSEREARRELDRITDVKQSAAGYGNYQQWIANTQLEQRVSLEDYSVSNRGLRSGLVGTPEQVIAQVQAFEDAGVDLLLLQCSPQMEEMERFAAAGDSAVPRSACVGSCRSGPGVARGPGRRHARVVRVACRDTR